MGIKEQFFSGIEMIDNGLHPIELYIKKSKLQGIQHTQKQKEMILSNFRKVYVLTGKLSHKQKALYINTVL